MAQHPERLNQPLKKKPDGSFASIALDQALDEIAAAMQRLKAIQGPECMAVWTGEAVGFNQQADYARRFIRAFGSPNYTSADSLCFSTRYIAYHLVHGYFNPCPDFANAELIVLWGTNPPISHPPFNQRIEQARRNGAVLVVVDPRRTRAARRADLFLQLRPGTDGALAWGLARALIATGRYDRQFVERWGEGFDRYARYAERFTPQVVADLTGLAPEDVMAAADLMAHHRPRVVHFVAIALEHHENALHNIRNVACLRGLCGSVDVRGGDPWPEAMERCDLALSETQAPVAAASLGADRYPLLYRYRNLPRFSRAVPEAEVELHPQDAARLGVAQGDRVRVTSPQGAIDIRARITGADDILPGVIQITHGWTEPNVNRLTDDRATDPVTGFPLLKAVPVRLEPIA